MLSRTSFAIPVVASAAFAAAAVYTKKTQPIEASSVSFNVPATTTQRTLSLSLNISAMRSSIAALLNERAKRIEDAINPMNKVLLRIKVQQEKQIAVNSEMGRAILIL